MRLYLPVLAISLALLAGCSRARVTTEIRSGGTFARTVALTGQEKKEGQLNVGDAIEDNFVLPSEGWKSRTEKKDGNITLTFERTFSPGASVKGDLSIKGEASTPMLVNEVAVTRLAPRRFEYRETLRWSGPAPDGMKAKPEDLTTLKAALPPSLATDENAHALAQKVAELAMPMLFGPGDPLLTLGLMHPDLAGHRLSQKVGGLMMKALEEQFGDKMTQAQRRDVTLKMIETTITTSRPVTPDASSGPPKPGKGSGLTPLMFVVKTPGKIVSSNGDLDELTGEVYWALYPPAAAMKPVIMTAIVEID
jgi:hypothetical protein